MAVNPFGAEQLGYNVDELVGQPVLSVSYESDREAVQKKVASCWNNSAWPEAGKLARFVMTAKCSGFAKRPKGMLESDTSTQRSSSAVLRYGLAVSSIAVALILTLLLHPDALQSPIFLLAIILSAWIGGIGPGLVAAALATLAIAYFFLPPIYSLKLDPAYTPQLLVFFLSALLVSSWSAARRRAEHALRRARDELEVKVQERTADLSGSNEQLQKVFLETQALRDRLRLVIDTIPVMVWSALPDGSVDFVNQRWVEYHGFSMEDVDRQGWEAVAHPEDLATALDKWRAAVAAGEPSEHELRVRRADGEYRWFLSRAVPLRDELGAGTRLSAHRLCRTPCG